MKLVRIFAPMMKHWLTMIFVIAMCTSSHSQTPSDGEKKTKFFGKINHWFTAYGMSSPDFLTAERIAFKQKAFAEVYVEAGINYDAWMFNLLDKVTKFRYPAKQEPHVIFQVKFTPKDSTLTNYSVQLGINVVAPVSLNLDDIAKEMESAFSGKWYENPEIAMPDVTRVLSLALTKVAEKVGDRLAPNLMVRYGGEVFWNGHEIPIFQEEGNYVELEAIDKNLEPIDPSLLKWTNADPSVSRGIVDMTGVTSKEVTLVKTDDEKNPLKVTIVKAEAREDINELLKQLIIEVLSAKKKEAQDTIVILKSDSTKNAKEVSAQIAVLEKDNLQMEDDGTRFTPLFESPQVLQDESYFNADKERVRGFELLKKRKSLHQRIRRKVNVVAFADLIVEKPEKVKDLLDELLKSSGRLIARLILNKDSKGQRDEARNIVIDFFNNNLEKIVGRQYPASATTVETLPPVVVNVELPRYQSGQMFHISSNINFRDKKIFEDSLRAYLSRTSVPTFVTINYSQDLSTEGFIQRTSFVRPKGLPEEYRYITFSFVNIPGSVKVQLTTGQSEASTIKPTEEIGSTLLAAIKQELARSSIGLASLPAEICNKGNGSATFLSPAGTLVILPSTKVKNLIFAFGFNTLATSSVVPGTLLGFEVDGEAFRCLSGLIHTGYYSSKDNSLYNPSKYIKLLEYLDAGKENFTMLLPCAVGGDKRLDLVRFKVDKPGSIPVDDQTVREKYSVDNFPFRLFTQFKAEKKKSYPIKNLPSIITLGDFRQTFTEETFAFFEDVCEDETIIPRFKTAEYYNFHPIFVHNYVFERVVFRNSTYDGWIQLLQDLHKALSSQASELDSMLANLPKSWSTLSNSDFERLARMMTITDYERLSLENRLLLLRIAADFASTDLADAYLRNLIVHTPQQDQSALIAGLITYGSRSNSTKKSLLELLIRDGWGIDGNEFTETITALTSWAMQYSPAPYQFTIKTALEQDKFIDFKPGFWFGDLLEERFASEGKIILVADGEQISARPFEYIYIRFHDKRKFGSYEIQEGEAIKFPAIYAYMLFNNENSARIRTGIRLTFDVAMLLLGVGELDLALQAKNSWRLYKAIVDVGISVADIGVSNVLAPHLENSKEGKILLSQWNTFMLFYAIGSIGEIAYTAALNNMRYTADEIIEAGALTKEDGTLKALNDSEKAQIDNMVKNAESASGLKANALTATLRTDATPEAVLKAVFNVSDDVALRLSKVAGVENIYKNSALLNRINALGSNKAAFLDDLTNTNQYFKPPISEKVADLDAKMIDVWEVMKTNGDGWPRKRLSFDYLNENKYLTKEEILSDLKGTSSRDLLASRLENTCPECSQAIKDAYKLNANVRAYIIPKIIAGEVAPNGMKWSDIYLHFIDGSTRLRYINIDTRAFDWNAFFTLEKYQAHHYFPVNLFAQNDGPFRFMFENIRSSRKTEILNFFNSHQNGILVPNKRIVNGEEYIIHTNHYEYEQAINDFLQKRRNEYIAQPGGLSNEDIAEFLYQDILEIRLEDLLIRNSLLDNKNINELSLTEVLK